MRAEVDKLCVRNDDYKARMPELTKKAPKLWTLLDLSCRLDIRESIRRAFGRRAFGHMRGTDDLGITINLADLTEKDRQTLGSCVNDRLEFRPGNLHDRLPEPTPKGLVEALQAVRAWRAKREHGQVVLNLRLINLGSIRL